jgi:hypothetical protein
VRILKYKLASERKVLRSKIKKVEVRILIRYPSLDEESKLQ